MSESVGEGESVGEWVSGWVGERGSERVRVSKWVGSECVSGRVGG